MQIVPMQTPDCELYLDSPNGHGSTNTTVRRYTNTRKNTLGAFATYADSATLGMSVTINIPGLYFVVVADSRSDGTAICGVTVNSSGLTTGVTGLTYAQGRRAAGVGDAGNFPNATAILRLAAGDVVRSQSSNSPNTTAATGFFQLVRIGA